MLSSYAANVARLSALVDAVESAPGRARGGVTIVPDERRLAFEALTLRVLVHPADGFGAARAGEALAALAARGVGYVVLDEEALGPEHFDAAVTIAADGGWTETAPYEASA
jgi:hypothetical protein